MGKKVIRLTEVDLQNIVKKVIEEQQPQAVIHKSGVIGAPLTLKNVIAKDYPNAKTRKYQVFEVKGKPSITKYGQDVSKKLLITKGMEITPNDFLNFKPGDEVNMRSTSPEDRGKYFQYVSLYINPQGKLELAVISE